MHMHFLRPAASPSSAFSTFVDAHALSEACSTSSSSPFSTAKLVDAGCVFWKSGACRCSAARGCYLHRPWQQLYCTDPLPAQTLAAAILHRSSTCTDSGSSYTAQILYLHRSWLHPYCTDPLPAQILYLHRLWQQLYCTDPLPAQILAAPILHRSSTCPATFGHSSGAAVMHAHVNADRSSAAEEEGRKGKKKKEKEKEKKCRCVGLANSIYLCHIHCVFPVKELICIHTWYSYGIGRPYKCEITLTEEEKSTHTAEGKKQGQLQKQATVSVEYNSFLPSGLVQVTTKLDTPVENETEEEADEEIERLDAELENINGVLAELKDKGQPCLLVRFSGCGGWTRIKACDCWRSSEGFDVASNVMWIEMGVTCLTCKGQFQGLWPTAMSSPSAVAAGGVDEAARKLSSNHS
eukprot:1160805-Pelagomonas_calceolata.AAC.2